MRPGARAWSNDLNCSRRREAEIGENIWLNACVGGSRIDQCSYGPMYRDGLTGSGKRRTSPFADRNHGVNNWASRFDNQCEMRQSSRSSFCWSQRTAEVKNRLYRKYLLYKKRLKAKFLVTRFQCVIIGRVCIDNALSLNQHPFPLTIFQRGKICLIRCEFLFECHWTTYSIERFSICQPLIANVQPIFPVSWNLDQNP